MTTIIIHKCTHRQSYFVQPTYFSSHYGLGRSSKGFPMQTFGDCWSETRPECSSWCSANGTKALQTQTNHKLHNLSIKFFKKYIDIEAF